jgi:tRNA (uracil-5-)-methyltransferase
MSDSLDFDPQQEGDTTTPMDEVKPEDLVVPPPPVASLPETPSVAIHKSDEKSTQPQKNEDTVDAVSPTSMAKSEEVTPLPQEEEEDDNDDDAKPSWDHSDRRVMLLGVIKYENPKKVKKMVQKWLDDLNKNNTNDNNKPFLVMTKVKKAPKKTWAAITFTQANMVEPFIQYVTSKNFRTKNGIIVAKRMIESNEYNNSHKRDRGDNDSENGRSAKRQDRKVLERQSRRPVTEEEIKDRICPLWRLSDAEQRDQKMKEMIKRSAVRIVSEVKSKFRVLEKEKKIKIPHYEWLTGKMSIHVKNLISVPSPIRNKVEFTFGYRYLFEDNGGQPSADTEPPKVPAVGFMVLGWAGGVSRPHCCPNIGPEFCTVSDLFDTFLKDSPLPPYDSAAHTGFWRLLTVRASRRTRQCMIIVTHSPSSGGQGDAVEWSSHVKTEQERLLSMLKDARLPVPDQEPIEVTSVYFQEYEGLSAPKPEDPVVLAYGKPTIEERLGKCTFHISPGAFFQVNTAGAEILFAEVVKKVKEVSDDPQNTLLFDVCCGTATIGLTCMKEGIVGKVVGIDISEPAIRDAEKNAEANGYPNSGETSLTRFVASRAEHVMQKEISNATKDSNNMKFVAVVDPAREGLHADVIRALRATEKIGRIVYVSCNPTGSLINDAGLLCTPPTKRYKGQPFEVESAQPVDMFPLTFHCEMIMVFDRLGTVKREAGQTYDS